MDNLASGRTRKGRETKERIYSVALKLIQQQGYEQTTLADICQAAAIANGTFYHYFRSKQDILVSFVREESLALWSYYNQMDKTSSASALLALINFQADYFLHKGTEFVSTFYAIMLQSKDRIYDYNDFALLGIMDDCLQRGQQAGEFSTQLSLGFLQELAISLLYLTTTKWCITEGSFDLKTALQEQYQQFIKLLQEP